MEDFTAALSDAEPRLERVEEAMFPYLDFSTGSLDRPSPTLVARVRMLGERVKANWDDLKADGSSFRQP